MRIHIFEKQLSLEEFFLFIKNKIIYSFEIDENSYTDEFHLLVIGTNEKNQSGYIHSDRLLRSSPSSKNRYI